MPAASVASLVVLSGAVLGACSGDDDSAGSRSTTTSTTASADRPLPTVTGPAADLPGYNVYRPADLDAVGRRLPVIAWANGGCVRHDGTWAPLLERFAAAGYVVVAITEPPPGADPTATGVTTADDQARAIDWAADQDTREGGPFEGRLDLDRVVAAGNSCGGITALQLAAQDERVRSVFVLSGSSAGPFASPEAASAVMSRIHVPVGFAVGGPEDLAYAAARLDYDVLPPGVPGFVASRASGDHPTVSTDVGMLGEVAEIGVHWLDASLTGDRAARRALTTRPCPSCAPDLWSVQAKHLDAMSGS